MSLRHTVRRKNGQRHVYRRLLRSVRRDGKVVQETVAPLGDVWLGLRLWQALRLDALCEELLPEGREEVPWAVMASVLVIARLGEPSSELHRVKRLSELFDISYGLLSHDGTSTYFERLAARNLGYEVFAGNRTDVTTAEEIVETMEARYGIAEARDWQTVRDGVEAKLCRGPDGTEIFLLCRSADRRATEQAMHERFAKPIEARPESLARRLEHARRRLDRETIGRQIGRLLGATVNCGLWASNCRGS